MIISYCRQCHYTQITQRSTHTSSVFIALLMLRLHLSFLFALSISHTHTHSLTEEIKYLLMLYQAGTKTVWPNVTICPREVELHRTAVDFTSHWVVFFFQNEKPFFSLCVFRLVAVPFSKYLGVKDQVRVRAASIPKLETFYKQRSRQPSQVCIFFFICWCQKWSFQRPAFLPPCPSNCCPAEWGNHWL